MKNKNFLLGTKWHFSAAFSPLEFKNSMIYKKMHRGNFCCIFYKESFATNLIKIGWELKYFEEFNFSPTLVQVFSETVRDRNQRLHGAFNRSPGKLGIFLLDWLHVCNFIWLQRTNWLKWTHCVKYIGIIHGMLSFLCVVF